ncbi:MAG: patatin-like phospholipase family protein, partial [Spirochaetia bacterium]|nr:patatin-like phospholipase family protein [Spirochaetia bacterium]
MFFKRKIGLVLAGGGGKGSYQLGVWKYLTEIGLTKKISVISGSSVGALNAILLSLCDFDTAVNIWTTQLEDNILDFKSTSKRAGAIFSREGLYKIMNQLDFSQLPSLKKKLYATCLNTDTKKAESF